MDDDRVAEVTRRRLEVLARELGVSGVDDIDDAGATGDDLDLEGWGPGRHARRPVTAPRRLGAWLADRTPMPLKVGWRSGLHLGSAQFGVVVLVVSLGLLLAAWWIVSGRPEAGTVVPVRTVPSIAGPVASSTPAAPQTAAAEVVGEATNEAASGGAMVVVDVAGRVRRPGIVVLPLGSRVVDAVEAAGGLRRGVRAASVNLARLLVDGEQIVVGQGSPTGGGSLAGASPGGVPHPAAPGLVNLNTADTAALESLPGVGPVTAQAILTWRTENGGFTAIDQLLEVSGIGEATLAEIAPHVTL